MLLKKPLSYIILATTLIATACGDDNDTPDVPAPTTPRTVLVYMVAQNNLSTYSTKDINEMTTAATNGDLGDSRLLYYLDSKTADPKLYELTADGSELIATYDDNTLSVSRERLEQVIEDAKTYAPAAKYGIIFWGHGTGYNQDGIADPVATPASDSPAIAPLSYGCETVNGVSHWMNTTTMARALDGKGFDWIYFDCCFMAGVEVAYEMRHTIDYIIGSVTEIPGNGMPYHKTLKYLMPGRSDLNGAARATFDHYDAFSGSERTCTMSVIKTSELDALADVMRKVYTTTKGLPDGYTPQAYQTEYYRLHEDYRWNYYDLGHYAEALASTSQVTPAQVNAAINRAVTISLATPKLWNDVELANHCGLSTLIIESPDDELIDIKNYRELSWWTDVVEPRFNQPN